MNTLTKEQEKIIFDMQPSIGKIYGKFFLKMDPNGSYKEDFLHCGLLAVVEHVRDYTTAKGKPITFFRPYILQNMRDFCTKNIFNSTEYLLKTSKKLRKEHVDKNLSLKELGKKIGVRPVTVQNALARTNYQQSSLTINDSMAEAMEEFQIHHTPETSCANKELRITQLQLCDEMIKAQKSETDRNFFMDKWGLNGRSALKMKELEKKYKLSHDDAICTYRRCMRHAKKAVFQSGVDMNMIF